MPARLVGLDLDKLHEIRTLPGTQIAWYSDCLVSNMVSRTLVLCFAAIAVLAAIAPLALAQGIVSGKPAVGSAVPTPGVCSGTKLPGELPLNHHIPPQRALTSHQTLASSRLNVNESILLITCQDQQFRDLLLRLPLYESSASQILES